MWKWTLSLVTLKGEYKKNKNEERVAGSDNENQIQNHQQGFTQWLNTSDRCRRGKVPVSSLANYGFIGLLNILSQYKQMRIAPSPSVLLPQIFNFWTSTDGAHICVTRGECWFTHRVEYQVSVCTYGNYHNPCISLCLSHWLFFCLSLHHFLHQRHASVGNNERQRCGNCFGVLEDGVLIFPNVSSITFQSYNNCLD